MAGIASIKRRLFITTALAAAVFGYARRAYAACYSTGSEHYLCAGASGAQNFSGIVNGYFETLPGFSSAGGIYVTGSGNISFIDNNDAIISSGGIRLEGNPSASSIYIGTSSGSQIYGFNYGIFAGVPFNDTATVTVESGGNVSSFYRGIFAGTTSKAIYVHTGVGSVTSALQTTTNYRYSAGIVSLSTGAGSSITIVADGDVSGFHGIDAWNRNYNGVGSDISITTGAGTLISGYKNGIRAYNQGTGSLTITANGDVRSLSTLLDNYGGPGSWGVWGDSAETGDAGGIYARNLGTSLTVTTGAASSVQSQLIGIRALNYGTGMTSVSAGGDVVSSQARAIYALGYGAGFNISTGSGGSVSGYTDGIYGLHQGSGSMTLDVNGDVIGYGATGVTFKSGPTAYFVTDMTVTTGAGSDIEGATEGMTLFLDKGTGAMDITIDGDITGHGGTGLHATTGIYASGFSIMTGVSSHITGDATGIIAYNKSGTGNVTALNIGGSVMGTTQNGIYVYDAAAGNGGAMTITLAASSDIKGARSGLYARHNGYGILDVTANGTMHGYSAYGMRLFTGTNNAGLYLTTGALANITGQYQGISATHFGSGLLSVYLNGVLTGGYSALAAYNSVNSSGIVVTTAHGSSQTGVYGAGIIISNSSAGAVSATTHSQVTSMNDNALQINTAGAQTDITIASDSTLIGANRGAWIISKKGDTTVTVDGSVTGQSNAGVYLSTRNSAFLANFDVDIGASAAISGATSGLFISNLSTGGGLVNAGVAGNISASGGDGVYIYNSRGSVSFSSSNGSSISGTARGVYIFNESQTSADVTIDGDVTGGTTGLYGRVNGSADLIINSHGNIYGGTTGVYWHKSGNQVSYITHHGVMTGGDTGLVILNDGTKQQFFTTDGTIEGKGGTAILFADDGNTSLNTQWTQLTITGGQIIGDIVDNYAALGFSRVTIDGDFSSDGDFKVSKFGVYAGATFSIGAGNILDSVERVKVNGIFETAGAGASVTNNLHVYSSGMLRIAHNMSIGGDLDNDGIVQLGAGATLTMNTISYPHGVFYFTIDSPANHGQLTITSGTAGFGKTNFRINVAPGDHLTDGDEILLIDAPNTFGAPGVIDDDSVLWDFTTLFGSQASTPTDDTDLFVIAHRLSGPALSFLYDTINNQHAGEALIALDGNTANPELVSVISGMNAASTRQEFNDILEAVQPAIDGGDARVAANMRDWLSGLTNLRLDDARGRREEDMTGMAAGDAAPLPVSAWAASFDTDDGNPWNPKDWIGGTFQRTNQEKRKGIDGYEATSGGGAFGVDTGNTLDDMTLGASFGYVQSRIRSFNANRATTDIDSYLATIYAEHRLPHDSFVNGAASYIKGKNETARYDVGGTPGLTAQGKFDSWQAGVYTKAGHRLRAGEFILTPAASLNWQHYSADDYTETGAGGASLNVRTQNLDSVAATLELKVERPIVRTNGDVILPEIHASYGYEFMDDPLHKTVQFAGGGPAFTVESPDPAQSAYTIGVGVKYLGAENWEFSAGYDLSLQEGYDSQLLMMKAMMRF